MGLRPTKWNESPPRYGGAGCQPNALTLPEAGRTPWSARVPLDPLFAQPHQTQAIHDAPLIVSKVSGIGLLTCGRLGIGLSRHATYFNRVALTVQPASSLARRLVSARVDAICFTPTQARFPANRAGSPRQVKHPRRETNPIPWRQVRNKQSAAPPK